MNAGFARYPDSKKIMRNHNRDSPRRGIRRQGAEVRGQGSGVRGQRSEVRDQKSEENFPLFPGWSMGTFIPCGSNRFFQNVAGATN